MRMTMHRISPARLPEFRFPKDRIGVLQAIEQARTFQLPANGHAWLGRQE